MAETAEACRLQDHLEREVNRGDECDHETDGRIATLMDALCVLPSRCAAMRRVIRRDPGCDPMPHPATPPPNHVIADTLRRHTTRRHTM
jgi:hypothetical protein